MKLDLKNTFFLLDMFLIVGGGEGSSNRNASRDESVEAGDKSVEAGDESIEAGEKTPQSCYNESLTRHSWFQPISARRELGKPASRLTSLGELNWLCSLPE